MTGPHPRLDTAGKSGGRTLGPGATVAVLGVVPNKEEVAAAGGAVRVLSRGLLRLSEHVDDLAAVGAWRPDDYCAGVKADLAAVLEGGRLGLAVAWWWLWL